MTTDDKAKLIEDTLNNRIREMEEAVDRVMGSPRSKGDWERGYAKGYARALEQLVELVEAKSHSYAVDDMVRDLAAKLRREVGKDE